ncbi:MAG: 6-carboxytetrahydropterin synthase [Eubacterium sp.]
MEKKETHPHTWEFMVDILMKDEKFIQFDAYEKAIDEYFNQYQNRIINQIPPFDETIPTLENMSDYFVYDIRRIVEKLEDSWFKMEKQRDSYQKLCH